MVAQRETTSAAFTIDGMSCASCVNNIKSNLKRKLGKDFDVQINLACSKAIVRGPSDKTSHVELVHKVIDEVEHLGYRARSTTLRDETFLVTGMTCTSCSANLERRLRALPGVEDASVNFSTSQAKVTFLTQDCSVADILDEIKKVGYLGSVASSDPTGESDQLRALENRDAIERSFRLFLISLLFSLPMAVFLVMKAASSIVTHNRKWFALTEAILATPCVLIVGKEMFKRAFVGMKHLNFGMDTLITVGVGGGYLFSIVTLVFIFLGKSSAIYFDMVSLLLTFVSLGRYLEGRAKGQTGSALTTLLRMAPETANVVASVETDVVQCVPASELQVGNIVRVYAGEKIPADGKVFAGESEVDCRMVTGESVPQFVKTGSEVIGGTLNVASTLHVSVEKVGSETVLAQIAKIVQDAQATKPAIQRVADKVAGRFVPMVLAFAVVAFIIWMILGALSLYPESWKGSEDYIALAFDRFFATVVISCPCALGLATPTAIMVGTGIGARLGVLIKSSRALETSAKINCVIFDKTGTLTTGLFSVVNSFYYEAGKVALSMKPEHASALVMIEEQSTHPIAQALAKYMRQAYPNIESAAVEDILVHAGKGVVARVNGIEYRIGSTDFVKEKVSVTANAATNLRNTSTSVVNVAAGNELVATFFLEDQPKPEAKTVVKKLQKMKIRVMVVSGDTREATARISALVGIPANCQYSRCFPGTKAEVVKEQQGPKQFVAFVGDGINDSPALTQADVGVAIGAGARVAIEAADVVLIKSDLFDILNLLKLSKKTVRRIYWNFVWAAGYNIVMIPMAAGLSFLVFGRRLPPIVAGITMATSSVLVVCSSLLLKTFKPIKTKPLEILFGPEP